MMILAIVGMAGAGKTVLSTHFRNRGLPVTRFGEVIIRELERRNLPLTPHSESIVRIDMRREYGMDACAKLTLPTIRALLDQHRIVVIDGLYSFAEYKTLNKEFHDNLRLLAIFTSKELRYQRLAIRPERPLNRAEAEARDVMEIERIEKGGPIALADFTLINDGTIDELTAQADALLSLLK